MSLDVPTGLDVSPLLRLVCDDEHHPSIVVCQRYPYARFTPYVHNQVTFLRRQASWITVGTILLVRTVCSQTEAGVRARIWCSSKL